MHEIAICETIIKVIEREAKRLGMRSVKKVKLRIGKMEAFEKSHLSTCLDAQKNNEFLKNATFEIEEVGVELKCSLCSTTYADERFGNHRFAHTIAHAPATYLPLPCPKCKGRKSRVVSGNEMELVSIED